MCSPVCLMVTPRHSAETCAAAHKPPHLWHHMHIQNMHDSQNTGQREKEYQHFLLSKFEKKTLDIPQFLQMTAIGACMQEVCVCVPFHIRGVLLEELSQLSLLNCTPVYIAEGSLLQMTGSQKTHSQSISGMPCPQQPRKMQMVCKWDTQTQLFHSTGIFSLPSLTQSQSCLLPALTEHLKCLQPHRSSTFPTMQLCPFLWVKQVLDRDFTPGLCWS